ncbi:hypothetical protein R6Q59_003772 [Mikania micrantha]
MEFRIKALAGIRRINLDGLRWRVFDAKGQIYALLGENSPINITIGTLGYRHIGHLKERSLKDQMVKDPTEVIRLRMLPRNKLRDARDSKLRIFSGSEHPFGDKPLEPFVMPPRQVQELRPRVKRAMIRAVKKAEQQEGSKITSKGKKREETILTF